MAPGSDAGMIGCASWRPLDEQKCIAPDLRQAMSQVPGCAAEIWQSRRRTGWEVIGRPHRKSKQAPLPLGAEKTTDSRPRIWYTIDCFLGYI